MDDEDDAPMLVVRTDETLPEKRAWIMPGTTGRMTRTTKTKHNLAGDFFWEQPATIRS